MSAAKEPFTKFTHEAKLKAITEWDGKDIKRGTEDL